MSLWQSHTWQKMLKKSGQIEQFFEIPHPNPLLSKEKEAYEVSGRGQIFVEKRQVSLGEFGLFVIGLDPAIVAGGQKFGELFSELKELCQKENCLFVQVETLSYNPPVIHDIPLIKGERAKRKGDLSLGYYKKFIPPYTAVIDLTKSEDEILAAMKPKGRYNIRLAEKKGVIVEQVEKNPHTVKVFFELMSETTGRDNFAGNTLQYYQKFLTELPDSQLFFAYFEGKAIAAAINVVSEDTMWYYYGASSSHNRNLMAPYLLQWTMICHAKKRKLTLYDFLGVAGPEEKDSPLAGVTDFKLKLTPDVREVSKSYIYVNKKWKYQAIMLIRRFRK